LRGDSGLGFLPAQPQLRELRLDRGIEPLGEESLLLRGELLAPLIDLGETLGHRRALQALGGRDPLFGLDPTAFDEPPELLQRFERLLGTRRR